jgi:NagD protein
VQAALSGHRLISTLHAASPAGAIVRLLEEATGVKAFSVGKPSPLMMRAARKELGLDAQHTFMIGDTMETDILGGTQLGYHTILVLSGGTRRETLRDYSYQPDTVVDSVATLTPEFLERCLRDQEPPVPALASI